MGTKMAVAFSVICMADFEERLLEASPIKPFVWKRFIDDIFSLWDIPAEEVKTFVDFANSFHPTAGSNLHTNCHLQRLFSLTQKFLKDHAFQLLIF